MATKLGKGPQNSYPWDQWFEKDRFTLKYNRDFECNVQAFNGQIRLAALKRGHKVSLKNPELGVIVVTVTERKKTKQRKTKSK